MCITENIECGTDISDKWERYYRPREDNGKVRRTFKNMCNLLEKYDGELLSNFADSHLEVKVQVFGFEDTIAPSHLQRRIESLLKCEKLIKDNQDTFVSFTKIENARYPNANFICHEDKELVSVSVNACKRYFQGRERFFNELRRRGDVAVSPYIGNEKKIRIKFSCGHTPPETTPNKYVSGRGCAICSRHIIIPRVNDFYQDHKDLLRYFPIPEQTLGVSSSNDKKHFELICPDCGIGSKTMTLANLCQNGFSCPYCSNKSSYFNRFMYKLLVELKVNFKNEVRFEWCRFMAADKTKERRGIYDFVIENDKLIIEMDGGFHDKPEAKYIDQEKNRLALEHGYGIVRIDCRYKKKKERFSRLVNEITDSDFSKYYSIHGIDLEAIDAYAMSNEYNVIVDLWNRGYSSKYIQNKIQCTSHTVASYLNEGNARMDCSYSNTQAKSRSKNSRIFVLSDKEIVGCFYSIQETKRVLCSLLGVRFDTGMISKNSKSEQELYHSLQFIRIEDEDIFVTELEKDPLLNIIATGKNADSCHTKQAALKRKVLQSNDFQSKTYDGTGDKYTGISFSKRKKKQMETKHYAVDLWNRGFSIAYIISKTKAKGSTIRQYLIEGTENSECNYSKNEARKRGYGTRVNVLFEKETVAAFVSIPDAVDCFNELFDKHYSVAKISNYIQQNKVYNQSLEIRSFLSEEDYVEACANKCLLNKIYNKEDISKNEMNIFNQIRSSFDSFFS